jgi:hypothetical protein
VRSSIEPHRDPSLVADHVLVAKRVDDLPFAERREYPDLLRVVPLVVGEDARDGLAAENQHPSAVMRAVMFKRSSDLMPFKTSQAVAASTAIGVAAASEQLEPMAGTRSSAAPLEHGKARSAARKPLKKSRKRLHMSPPRAR